MTDQPDRTLLDAVDALSKPQNVVEWQEAVPEKGIDRQIRKRTNPPLLDWLALAVANNIGGGGGGKPARERTPIDIAALTLYEDIDGRIRSWLDDLGARPGKDVTPTQALRSWYALWIGGHHGERLEDSYAAVLEGWEQRIKDVLDPPKRIEITAPCPICGQEWQNLGLKLADGSDDPDDVERVRVLNAVERESIDESYALCSACDRVWKGPLQLRALRIAIDDAEALKALV
jgi:hypothetical protein